MTHPAPAKSVPVPTGSDLPEVVGTAKLQSGSAVPTVPTGSDRKTIEGVEKLRLPSRLARWRLPGVPPQPLSAAEISRRDAYEERSAILEYDAGLTREEAEATALAEIINQ
ncbi:hypothetical protein M0638_26780 [Roseomonas sp. NAR14]|uniref:Uncharacterized protein n=1 Tax=Roseomonas acroporae TaxID=2937791 RepID=A0A9X2C0B7_9PROT|nr:hypothetical protein [Roseomonas acroporae]MCK8787965.1 hypothetical protein [Roseomonas acroporae]